MHFHTVPHYSDDDDCTLLAEVGHLRFSETGETPISFGQQLQAFAMFDFGFAYEWMNSSQRVYVASPYQPSPPGQSVTRRVASRQELLEKMRRTIEFTQSSAIHFCSTSTPTLQIMAYSSSAGAAAAVASEYESVEALLLVAPSHDVPCERVQASYARFQGNVRVLIGESDQVVLPQQAFWHYEGASRAASREYVELPSCGHAFEGPHNKARLLAEPQWAFGHTRPEGFAASLTTPSEVWQ